MPTCPKCKKTVSSFPCEYCGFDGGEFVEKYARKDDTGER